MLTFPGSKVLQLTLCDLLLFDLVILQCMQFDIGRNVLSVSLVSKRPVVAPSIGKYGSVAVECSGSDGRADVGEVLQPLSGVLVPEAECSVGASRREGSMNRMERDAIEGIDEELGVGSGRGACGIDAVACFPVTTEREPLLLLLCIVNVLDGTSGLDGTDRKPVSRRITGHTTGLVLQWRHGRFVDLLWVGQVNDGDVSLSTTHHQKLLGRVHAIYLLRKLDHRDGLRQSHVPVFQCLIPRARDNHFGVGGSALNRTNSPHWRIVHTDLLRLLRGQIKELYLVIGASTTHPRSVSQPSRAEHRSIMLEEGTALVVSGVGVNVVDANLLVPGGDRQKVLLGRKGQVCDGIFGAIVEGYVIDQFLAGGRAGLC